MARKRYSFDEWHEPQIIKTVSEDEEHDMSIETVRTGTVSVIIKVKIRSTPMMDFHDSNVITTLPDGAKVEIFGEENGFYHIKFDDTIGYCDKRFVIVDE